MEVRGFEHYPNKEPRQPVVEACSQGADAGNHTESAPEAIQRPCQHIDEHSSRNHEHLPHHSHTCLSNKDLLNWETYILCGDDTNRNHIPAVILVCAACMTRESGQTGQS